MAIFLSIFFFTIAQYFENKITQDQIDFLIDTFIGNHIKPLSTDQKNNIKDYINQIFEKQDFSQADDVEKQNQIIVIKALKFVGIIVGIIIFPVLLIRYIYKWNIYNIKYLFHSSLLTLIIVAITETLFMYLIAQNYLSADPNKIKFAAVDILKNNRCNPSSEEENCITY